MSEAKGFLTLSEAAMKAVDENGLLPCPVKTEDPFEPFFGKAGYRDGYSWQGWKACQPIVVNGTAVGELYVYGNTEEECRDNWNRRVR